MAGTTSAKEVKTNEEASLKRRSDFIRAVGRRKKAVAQVRLFQNGKGDFVINDAQMAKYFPYYELQEIVEAPLKESALLGKVDVSIKVRGGGKRGQAEAIQLGIARTIIKLNEDYKKSLRALGYVTRDSRVKERKKPGLKRARRAPQWSKR